MASLRGVELTTERDRKVAKWRVCLRTRFVRRAVAAAAGGEESLNQFCPDWWTAHGVVDSYALLLKAASEGA
jgi:hypothetical protein